MKRRALLLIPLVWAVAGLLLIPLLQRATAALVAPPVAARPATSAAPRRPALTDRVVLVILSGVGADTLNDPANPFAFRTLRRLAAEGAWGLSRTVVPAGDAPTWLALISGATPAQSGAVTNAAAPAPGLATLFGGLGAQRAAMVWRSGNRGVALPTDLASSAAFSATTSAAVAPLAADILARRDAALVVVVLDQARTI